MSFPVQEKYKKRNETLEGVEEIRGEDDRGVHLVHLEQPVEDADPDSTFLQDIDQGQFDEIEVIAGVMRDEKGEDVEVSSRGVRKTKTLLMMSLTYPMYQQGKQKMASFTGTSLMFVGADGSEREKDKSYAQTTMGW